MDENQLHPEAIELYKSLNGEFEYNKLSKRQKKVLQKLDNKVRNKKIWRKAYKEKRKIKKIEAIKNGDTGFRCKKELKFHISMAKSSSQQRIAIDLSFINESFMQPKDILKCVNQVHRCYSTNRRLEAPTQLHLCSIMERAKQFLSKHNGYDNWDVHLKEQNYIEVFKKEDIVYLTSDSENVLNLLDHDKVYIIGGLVDHNHHKGLCYKLAEEKGVSHARFPIDEYVSMKSRKVLTINQVFEILCKVVEGKSWQEAFISAIPSRKEAEIKLTEIPS